MFLKPDQIAEQYPRIAVQKVRMPPIVVFAKGVLAGIFIAMAAYGALMVGSLMENEGTARLIGALLFPCGLTMVLFAGGELFTGNALMAMAAGRNSLSVGKMLKNWLLVYLGNFAGSVSVAAMAAYVRQGDMAFIQFAVLTADAKTALTISEAFVRAVLCNMLVCTAVWMSYSSESTTGKIAAIYFPVMTFVLIGAEHSVANMMFFPVALWLGGSAALSWPGFLLGNLLPVTLGNIVGGALVIGGLLTLSFRKELRPRNKEEEAR